MALHQHIGGRERLIGKFDCVRIDVPVSIVQDNDGRGKVAVFEHVGRGAVRFLELPVVDQISAVHHAILMVGVEPIPGREDFGEPISRPWHKFEGVIR
jgi:hypothetical protein